MKYTKDVLAPIVAEVFSYAELARRLGILPTGSNTTNLRRRCDQHGIDTSHMTGQGHARGKRAKNYKTYAHVLVERKSSDPRVQGATLTRALIESGRTYVCVKCANDGTWMGEELRLQVDHIDGKYWNNVVTNLRFMCHNCHSQTDTYGAKNKKDMPEWWNSRHIRSRV